MRLFPAVVLVVLGASACTPSCERTCRKVLKCDNLESDRVSVAECQLTCDNQRRLYAGWDDEKELEKALDAHRRCLVGSTCEQIEAGECYDDRLFPVGQPVDSGI